MNARSRNQKPPNGSPLDVGSPLACGLVALWPLWEGGGVPYDVVNRVGAASNSLNWAASPFGWALQGTGTSNGVRYPATYAGPRVTGRPWTFAAFALPTANANGLGLIDTTAGGRGGFSVQLNVYGGQIFCDVNGVNYQSAGGISLDNTYHLFSVVQPTATQLRYFRDGKQLGSSAVPGYPAPITGSTYLCNSADGGNGFLGLIGWLAVWSRALSQPELYGLSVNPWQLFAPNNVAASIPMAITPGFSVQSPPRLYASNPSTVLTLLGFGTNWTPETPFAVAGIADATVTGKTVAGTTQANITVETGPATGPLTVTDGTLSAPIAIAARSMLASPWLLPTNHSHAMTIELVGTGTTWASGTTVFSVAAGAGITILGQTINSPTSATLRISTGATAGSCMLSDGTSTTPLTVTPAVLTVSPNPAAATQTLVLTGTNTVWLQETPAGLFGASGPAGVSLTNIVVLSDTSATAVLAGTTANGTVTITDNSTLATTTVVAEAVPVGSLHVGGQMLLGPTSGSTLFGACTAATIAFQFRLDSNAGLNLSSGTTVVGWGANAKGGGGLAVYCPASRELIVTAYGGDNSGYATQTFSAAIPIQAGVGYHVLLSWGATPQLYVNGLLYATAGFSGTATFPYQQIQVGGNAGPGIMLDHAIANLAVWDTYAATASDAAALADGSATPLQVGGTLAGSGCSAWWPLGGGPIGASPSIAEQWLGDYSSGGNSLSVLQGSLTSAGYAASITTSSPVQVAAMVSKCGKLAIFGTNSTVPAANGAYPLAPISAVNATPTVYRNGTQIQLGPATWMSAKLDTAFIAYLLQCGSVQAIAIANGGTNYSNPTVSASGGGGTGLTLGTPQMQMGVISFIPVVDGGEGFTGMPTITISDPTGTGASVFPIMTGVGREDPMAYDAPASWLTPAIGGLPLGGLQAATAAPMSNWTGTLEGAVGGFAAFSSPPTMLAGANVGEQPMNPNNPTCTVKNRMFQGDGFNVWDGGGVLTRGPDRMPVSWTQPSSTTLSNLIYDVYWNNEIDSMGSPNYVGQWTFRYRDPNVNTPAAMALWLTASNITGRASLNAIATPVNLSGPNAGTSVGVVVDPADITIVGTKIAGITLDHTQVGTGYQGAIVVISGGGGYGPYAYATATVTNGTVTAINILCGGNNFGGKPTVTIYGTAVNGTTVTAIYDFRYLPNPAGWDIGLSMLAMAPAGGDGLGHWTAGDLYVIPPDVKTGQPGTVDASMPLATDDNVLRALTTPTGRTPAALRFMDVTQGYGGVSNYVYPTDLQDPYSYDWNQRTTSVGVAFQAARYINTNPGSSIYGWSSTRVYGPQAYFIDGPDAPTTVTGTLTSGSTTVTGFAAPGGIMTGSPVAGAGIPAGTYIAGINGTAGTFTLSRAATASGPETLTVAGLPCVTLPTTDDGFFINNAYGSQGWAVFELVSAVPHGFTTGQLITMTGTASIPITNHGNWSPGGGGATAIAWVTGPCSFACSVYIGGSAPSSVAPQTLDATTQVALTAAWNVTLAVPINTGSVPYDYSAAMVSQLPGCALWVNIPHLSADALITALAHRVIPSIGPTNDVYLEYGNENWNGSGSMYLYGWALSTLLGYLPPGTQALGYYTSNGGTIPNVPYGAVPLLSAHAYDVFIAAWTAAGLSADRIHRVHGSWYGSSGTTQDIICSAERYGFRVDHIAVAPYLAITEDAPIVAAFAPAGSTTGAASWPVDAINDFVRFWMCYCTTNQAYLLYHARYCQAMGQPVVPAALTTSGTASTTGGLAGGTYYACCTFEDPQGRETTVGLSRSGAISINAGAVPTLSMPAWPTWAASMNVYVTPPNGAPGSEVFYLSVPLASYRTTCPPGTPIPLDTAIPSSGNRTAPATNLAAANAPVLPTLIAYEGGVQTGLPGNLPLLAQVMHDQFYHSSYRDLIRGWFAACQLGCQTVAGSGMTLAMYYQIYDAFNYPAMWLLSAGPAQPPGDGQSNQFATIQGGLPADGHDHGQYNEATGLQGMLDWVDASSLLPGQPVAASAKRRWFSGSGQLARRFAGAAS